MTQDPGKRAAGVPRRGPSSRGPGKSRPSIKLPSGPWPFIVAGVAVVALLVTMVFVGFNSLRPPDPIAPTASPEPTGPPELPRELGQFVRNPADPPDAAPGPDTQGRLVATGTYIVDGQQAIIVTVVRPASDAEEVLAGAGASLIRPTQSGFCGREASRDLDTCAAGRRNTVVLVTGWRGQTVDELASIARQFANQLG